jgi:hypothetical protein
MSTLNSLLTTYGASGIIESVVVVGVGRNSSWFVKQSFSTSVPLQGNEALSLNGADLSSLLGYLERAHALVSQYGILLRSDDSRVLG